MGLSCTQASDIGAQAPKMRILLSSIADHLEAGGFLK
jgi:hypothetical protein